MGSMKTSTSHTAAWLSSTSTTFVMDMILAFACGLGLFLELLPWLQCEPSLPASRKRRNIRKHPVQMKWTSRSRKRTGTFRAEGSRDLQKVRFQLREDLGKSLGHIPGKAPKDVSRALGSSPRTVQGVILENHMETRKSPYRRAQETNVCPIQKFCISKPCNLQALEIHITRFRVRHRWGLPLKFLKAINIFRPTKAPLFHPFHCLPFPPHLGFHGLS
ncbi:spermatogenesis-associated protein 31-like [Octodon degus]|uniref:Spermatogenesis-associated protein 31-like n=1 Tax=Octodon degus TaxID=10160 RepID=A0A6P6DXL7_OCTDE|nr:spermatogenesis-associated protein 31-like [Octodon degus]